MTGIGSWGEAGLTRWAEHEAALTALMTRLGCQDRARMRLALTHKSYAHEQGTPGQHNERLEFLGDAVLDLVIAEALMAAQPLASEGDLTRLRAGMVNERSFGEAARALDLGPLLLLGKGERLDKGHDKDSLLSDAFEAVIAALFLERGLDAVRGVIAPLFGERIEAAMIFEPDEDYKSRLQAAVQRAYSAPPLYVIVAEDGPEHGKQFTVELWFDEALKATGQGRTKKIAERAAAKAALEAWPEAEVSASPSADD